MFWEIGQLRFSNIVCCQMGQQLVKLSGTGLSNVNKLLRISHFPLLIKWSGYYWWRLFQY